MVSRSPGRHAAGHGHSRSQYSDVHSGLAVSEPKAVEVVRNSDGLEPNSLLSKQRVVTSRLNGSRMRRQSGHAKIDLQSIMKFEKDREFLKAYIEKHFSDSQMIDYEKETKG